MYDTNQYLANDIANQFKKKLMLSKSWKLNEVYNVDTLIYID